MQVLGVGGPSEKRRSRGVGSCQASPENVHVLLVDIHFEDVYTLRSWVEGVLGLRIIQRGTGSGDGVSMAIPHGVEEEMAQLVFLRVEVGASFCLVVLTHASGKVCGEEVRENP